MASDIDQQARKKSTFEFHFQEVFTGERIDMISGGTVHAQIVAKTRFQTGLAHIETLRLRNGEQVVIAIEKMNLRKTVKVDVAKPFVTLKMIDGSFQVEKTETRPGYL